MKRMPLAFAAMVPLMAVAAPDDMSDKTAYDRLTKDTPISEILGADVKDSKGDDIGEVEDVVIGADGEIKSVLVDRFVMERRERVAVAEREGEEGDGKEYAGVWGEQDNDRMQRLSSTDWAREKQHIMPRVGVRDDKNLEQTAGYDSEGYEEPRNVKFGWNEQGEFAGALTEVEWADVDFDAAGDELRISDDVDLDAATKSDQADFTSGGERLATEVIGMEVNVLDDDSFGEVEDIMIDTDNDRATAYVVDSIDFYDKERYALPTGGASVNADRDEVNYQFSSRDVKRLGEFDLDKAAESR